MNLSSVDVKYVVQELQSYVGGKIEKITQSDKEKRDVLFTLYGKGVPKMHLRAFLPSLLAGYEMKPAYQKIPPGFAMFLRKYIQNSRIMAIAQQGFDRLISINLDTKYGDGQLIIEMIPPGNIVFVLDEKIKGLLENQNYKDRTLRGGIPYEPPYASFDLPNASEADIVKAIQESDRDTIVTTLAMTLSLGGVYAEAVCERAGVDKSTEKPSEKEIKKIVKAAKEITNEEISVHKDTKRVYPFKVKDAEPVEGSFLQSLTEYIPVNEAPAKKRDKKLDTMHKAQKKNIEKQLQIATESRAIGEKIYTEYHIIQDILKAAETARNEKKDITKFLEKFPQVKKYNKKTQEIEVEL